MPLLLRERELLEHYGKDHPEVQAVRARINLVREWLSRQPPSVVRVEARTPSADESATATQPNPSAPVRQETKPLAASPPIVERVIEVRHLPAEQPAGSSTRILVQLISILSALVVMLLVQLVALMLILRRYASRLSSQVRVELVNIAGGQSAPFPAEVRSQRIYLGSSEASSRRQSPPPMPDIPSDDVRPSEEDEAEQQDAAVFRQVFEDNLRLREQLVGAGREK